MWKQKLPFTTQILFVIRNVHIAINSSGLKNFYLKIKKMRERERERERWEKNVWKNNEKIVYCRQRNVDHGATIQTPPIIIFPAHLNTPFHFILSLSLVLFSHSIPVHHKKMSIICIWLTGAFFPFFAFYYKILKMCFPATKNNNKQEYKKNENITLSALPVLVSVSLCLTAPHKGWGVYPLPRFSPRLMSLYLYNNRLNISNLSSFARFLPLLSMQWHCFRHHI